jgi:hypothetical protein
VLHTPSALGTVTVGHQWTLQANPCTAQSPRAQAVASELGTQRPGLRPQHGKTFGLKEGCREGHRWGPQTASALPLVVALKCPLPHPAR